MINRLREDARVQLAGAIASFFRIDPIDVLKSDYFTWSVRVAAYEHAVEARNKAMEAAQRKAK